MPTYEYRCTSCGHQYETKEGFDAPARQECPSCGSLAKRMLFPPPIVFKGSGFYVTDSRKGSSVTVGGDTGPASSETKKENGAAAPASDSKPAAAPASDSKPAAAPAASSESTE